MIVIRCVTCGKNFSLAAGLYNARKKQNAGSPPRFCSRGCISAKTIHSNNNQNPLDPTFKIRDKIEREQVKSFKDMTPDKKAEMEKLYTKKGD